MAGSEAEVEVAVMVVVWQAAAWAAVEMQVAWEAALEALAAAQAERS